MPERDEKGRFIKTPAPDPEAARPKQSAEEKQRISELGKKGMDRLESMMDDPETDAALLARVAIFCVEKAYGKARQEADAEKPGADSAPRLIVRRKSHE